MNRHFTVAQAEALLPQVEASIRDAIELKKFYLEAKEILETELQRIQFSGGAKVDSMRVQSERSRLNTCAERLNAAIERIHSYGCEVKDLDIGLIDFRTLYKGQEVYLCWRLGESGITYWHGLEEGFRGRKPIDEEFLAIHRAG
ncbi:MAG: DUF2203 domain-containing protein [Acidobacteria bacterium]|nr:DUF2203 domain-containing protein [Acidobacteriota bacterium]